MAGGSRCHLLSRARTEVSQLDNQNGILTANKMATIYNTIGFLKGEDDPGNFKIQSSSMTIITLDIP